MVINLAYRRGIKGSVTNRAVQVLFTVCDTGGGDKDLPIAFRSMQACHCDRTGLKKRAAVVAGLYLCTVSAAGGLKGDLPVRGGVESVCPRGGNGALRVVPRGVESTGNATRGEVDARICASAERACAALEKFL